MKRGLGASSLSFFVQGSLTGSCVANRSNVLRKADATYVVSRGTGYNPFVDFERSASVGTDVVLYPS
jgi:hypothetical protein